MYIQLIGNIKRFMKTTETRKYGKMSLEIEFSVYPWLILTLPNYIRGYKDARRKC